MRLGLNLGYWSTTDDDTLSARLDRASIAEDLGYDSVWVAEAYGTDAASVLGYLAARTSRIGLGSAVFQIPGRTPALAAMTTATLDLLSHGRFRLGLGVSGPQVSEGWHGVRFDKPLARTREYVELVRLALNREVLRHDGKHFPLPLPDGPGKALRLAIGPVQERVPIYLAALGPRNLELAGEVADGWLGVFFSSRHSGDTIAHLRAGRSAAGLTSDDFDVAPSVPVVVGDDVSRCADQVRAYAALYIGGMGSRDQNFYHRLATSMGYGAEADVIQQHFLARDYAAAAAAVPEEFIDATSLLGPPERIVTRMHDFARAGVTTLIAQPYPSLADPADLVGGDGVSQTVELLAQAWRASGLSVPNTSASQ